MNCTHIVILNYTARNQAEYNNMGYNYPSIGYAQVKLAKDVVFESTNDGIIILDKNYTIIDFNISAASICSTLLKNAIGKHAQAVLGDYHRLYEGEWIKVTASLGITGVPAATVETVCVRCSTSNFHHGN